MWAPGLVARGVRLYASVRFHRRMEGFAMRNGKIGVGIIGVQPGRSFSAIAHIPALKALPQFEIVAISTTHLERAQAAG